MWLRGGHFFNRGTEGAYIEVSCGKEILGGSRDSDRDSETNEPPSISGRLEVYEVPMGPSKYRLRGRRFSVDQDQERYLALIRNWLANCCENHELCKLGLTDKMPTRVIDVDNHDAINPEVRLISSQGIHEKYIALSYCWGATAKDILTLDAATYDAMRKRILESDLAKTHQEVIQIARALRIRYVWIDALCIIQGDAEDWERESVSMASVYGNATLTIVAGRSSDSRKGFITNNLGSGSRVPSCKLPTDTSKDAVGLVVDLPRSCEIGPVSTRGWCFQERLTCRRAVVFGEEQLLLQCIRDTALENGRLWAQRIRPVFLRPAEAIAKTKDATALRDQALQEWYTLLKLFVITNLSNPHDIFAAIAALAQEASRVLNSRYLAGLWECDMARGLLWRPCYHFQAGPNAKIPVTRPKSTFLTKETGAVVRAPSWSWAAVQGPVTQELYTPPQIKKYKDPAYQRVRPKHTNPDRWTLDPHCGVKALHMPTCELQLVGHVAEVEILRQPLSEYLELKPKWLRLTSWTARQSGLLLADREMSGEATAGEGVFSQVAAVGFFDVSAERQCFDHVWCLPIVKDKGLVLKKNADDTFSRVGWFLPRDGDWLAQRKEVEVRLC